MSTAILIAKYIIYAVFAVLFVYHYSKAKKLIEKNTINPDGFSNDDEIALKNEKYLSIIDLCLCILMAVVAKGF